MMRWRIFFNKERLELLDIRPIFKYYVQTTVELESAHLFANQRVLYFDSTPGDMGAGLAVKERLVWN